jgi:hypothetical protein
MSNSAAYNLIGLIALAWALIKAVCWVEMGGQMSVKQFDVAAFARLSAEAVQLPIPPEFEAGVIGNLERLFELAEPLASFVLDDEIEPAPVFQP